MLHHHHLLLTTLTSLLTLTTSTPLNPTFTLPHPTPLTRPHSITTPTPSLPPNHPTIPESDTAKATSLTHQIATLLAEDALSSYDESTCPPSHRSKQCCTSINGLADDLTGQLGDVVPWVSGVSVSSLVGLQCTKMADDAPNVDCFASVMCCAAGGGSTGSKGVTNEKPGTQSLFKSGCIPFDKAIADKKEAIEKSKVQASMLAAEGPAPSASVEASGVPRATADGMTTMATSVPRMV
ncbi:hypothetical protein BJX70DRAFT_216678 [Aspergillus crustosus]